MDQPILRGTWWSCALPLSLVIFSILPVTAQEFVITSSNVTYSGLNISNPTGICINIRPYSQNVRIINSTIGPCGDAGIHISAYTTGMTIDNTFISNTNGNGIQAYQSSNITVTNNRITNARSGIYAQDVTGINVSQNRFVNALGPYPRGQFVQFNRVTGSGNIVKCNIGDNSAGIGAPEEAINMYDSFGSSSSPIIIEGNKIKGGGASGGGGGVMLGDGGGGWQIARDNIVVDPGQQGMAIAGGNNIQMLQNRIYGRWQTFTNVGMYVWNQYTPLCSGNTVQNNVVDYTSSSGTKSGFWNGNNCGVISGLSLNNFTAALSDQIFNETPGSCPATTAAQYLSDLPYQVINNGWGPAEKDTSNGEAGVRDGRQMSIAGVKFSKGLGVHAYSDIRYPMGGKCSTFSARIGIDDEVRPNGSVVFQVIADGVSLFNSGVQTGTMPAGTVSVNVTGKSTLQLLVTSLDNYNFDHADWADISLICTP